jgi:hypothetical protein
MSVQKHKPKSTPYSIHPHEADSAARTKRAIQVSKDAIAESKKLVAESQKTIGAIIHAHKRG